MPDPVVRIVFNRFDELAAQFEEQCKVAVQKAAFDIEARAKELAPVDTGNLRRSIHCEFAPDGLTGAVGTVVEYAVYQEFGTVKVPPHPYLRPAADEVGPSFVQALTNLATKGGGAAQMNQVDTALYGVFTGSTNLAQKVTGCYHGAAPNAVTYPVLVFQEITGSDSYTLSKRVARELLYQVSVLAEGWSAKAAGEAMDIVDGLLHNAALSVSGYATLYVRRAGSREFVTVEGGVAYWHESADYRVIVSPT